MAKKYTLQVCTPLIIFLSYNNAFADDLLTIYSKAAEKDPVIQQARASYEATKQNCPIALADLLPSLVFKAGISYSKVLNFTTPGTTTNPSVKNPSVRQSYFEFNLGQSLFEWDKISRLLQSEIEVHKAIHDLETAKQDLLVRVTKAYFNVLQAEDTYEYNATERYAVKKLYDEAKEKFDVGLIAIGDVEEAKARFDLKSADEIRSKNDVADRYEELNAIVGERIKSLSVLTPNFKPTSPKPANIEEWVKMALKRNHSLAAEELAIQIQDKNVDIAFADHLPKIRANARYSGRKSSRSLTVDEITASQGYFNSYGASIDGTWELFASGGTQAKIEREKYNTTAQCFKTEKLKRTVISETRQSFRNIITSLNQAHALEQAQKSSLIALDATKAGYEIGTRASIDVLDRLTDVYDQKRRLAEARYSYVNNIVNLKFQSGILTNNDLNIVNNWLISKPEKEKLSQKTASKSSILETIENIDSKADKQAIDKPKTPEKTESLPKSVPQTKKNSSRSSLAPLKAETKAEPIIKKNNAPATKSKSIVDATISKPQENTDTIQPEKVAPSTPENNEPVAPKSPKMQPKNPIIKSIETFENDDMSGGPGQASDIIEPLNLNEMPPAPVKDKNSKKATVNNKTASAHEIRQQRLEDLEIKLKQIIAEYKSIKQ